MERGEREGWREGGRERGTRKKYSGFIEQAFSFLRLR